MTFIKVALIVIGAIIGIKLFSTVLGGFLRVTTWFFSLPTVYALLILVGIAIVIFLVWKLLPAPQTGK